jgi:aconitase A
MMNNRPTPDQLRAVPPGEFPSAQVELRHGDVLIAAITSCTNTSNRASCSRPACSRRRPRSEACA